MDDVNHEQQTKPAHDDPPEAVTPLLLGQVEVFLYAVSKHRLIASTTSRLDATVAREESSLLVKRTLPNLTWDAFDLWGEPWP